MTDILITGHPLAGLAQVQQVLGATGAPAALQAPGALHADGPQGGPPRGVLVLVYGPPQAVLAAALLEGAAGLQGAAGALQDWMEVNLQLLALFHRFPRQCLLVHGDAVAAAPRALLDLLSGSVPMERGSADADQPLLPAVEPLAVAAAGAWMRGLPRHLALYHELESLAHIGGADHGLAAWRAYQGLLETQRQAEGSRAEQLALLQRVDAECLAHGEARARADALEQACAERHGQVQSLEAQLQGVQAELARMQQAQSGLRAENDLLFIQLQEVQAELDARSSPGATRSGPSPALPSEATAASGRSEALIDLRQDIDGDNWYYPEHDGRWAGPGAVSILRTPALREGRYLLELDVVDAMDRKLLTGMSVSVNGFPLVLRVDGRGVAARVDARFASTDFAAEGVWEVQFRFPHLISPAQRGSSDSRMLAVRLRTVKLKRIG